MTLRRVPPTVPNRRSLLTNVRMPLALALATRVLVPADVGACLGPLPPVRHSARADPGSSRRSRPPRVRARLTACGLPAAQAQPTARGPAGVATPFGPADEIRPNDGGQAQIAAAVLAGLDGRPAPA